MGRSPVFDLRGAAVPAFMFVFKRSCHLRGGNRVSAAPVTETLVKQ